MQDNATKLSPARFTDADIMQSPDNKREKSPFSQWVEKKVPMVYVPCDRLAEADYLITGDFGFTYEKFKGVRIFISGENHAPNLSLYDYCLTHSLKESDRCLYHPYWFHVAFMNNSYKRRLTDRPAITAADLAAQNREFCSFICRNPVCRVRNNFVRHLGKRKRVNCPGPFMHNTDFVLGKTLQDKLDYQSRHLFSVAYENEASPGYATEKILDAFAARTIPIYWGDPLIENTFNPAAFVHARRFKNEKALIDHILGLAQDPERCAQMLNEPVFLNPNIVEEKTEKLLRFWEGILQRGPVIRRTRWQRIDGVLCKYYGHGLFRTLRRISRSLRGKK